MEGHFSTPRHPRLRWSHHGATRQKYDHKRKWTSHCAADLVPGHYCLTANCFRHPVGKQTWNIVDAWRYLPIFCLSQHVVLLKEMFTWYRFTRMTLASVIDFVASTLSEVRGGGVFWALKSTQELQHPAKTTANAPKNRPLEKEICKL